MVFIPQNLPTTKLLYHNLSWFTILIMKNNTTNAWVNKQQKMGSTLCKAGACSRRCVRCDIFWDVIAEICAGNKPPPYYSSAAYQQLYTIYSFMRCLSPVKRHNEYEPIRKNHHVRIWVELAYHKKRAAQPFFFCGILNQNDSSLKLGVVLSLNFSA